MIPTLALLSLVAVVRAEEPPLAVPAGPPVATQARLTALRAYKANRLDVREEVELRGGGAWSAGGAWGGYWGPGWGYGGYAGPVVVDPIQQVRTWGVYRGPERLDVPTFLDVAGAAERKQDLDLDLDRLKRRSQTWSGLAGVGIAGIVAGLVGTTQAARAEDVDAYVAWNWVTLGSSGVLTAGFIGASFPRSKASALRRYPSASMTSAEARQLVDAHNDALRDELGLSAADVWAVEAE